MIFKSFVSKNQSSNGDDIWISQCGHVCVIIDAVTISQEPSKTKTLILEFLTLNETDIIVNSQEQTLSLLNSYLLSKGDIYFASVCILKKESNTIKYYSVGNSQIVKISEGSSSYILQPLNQPESIVGLSEDPKIESGSFLLEDNALYFAATDGLCLDGITFADTNELSNNNEWHDFAKNRKKENDWCFVIFPFEATISYEKYEWAYFPFLGQQEEYEHEKKGLSMLADVLFDDPDFYGFRILGGADIPLRNTNRKLDGILVSPYGIVLLELKDLYGEIEVPIEGRNRPMIASFNGQTHRDTSPIVKVNEVLDGFSDWSIFSHIQQLSEKRIGAVIFTNRGANIKCVNSIGDTCETYKVGNVLICKVEDFAKKLKYYWRNDLGNGKKHKIAQQEIDIICDNYSKWKPVTTGHDDLGISICNGKYFFTSSSKNHVLSTEYYSLYKGEDSRRNKSVWIKEFELTTISKGLIQDEAKRIKRETEALKDLNKSLNIQDYRDEDLIGTKLYVVLEFIEGLTLQDFLKKQHISHGSKLEIIYKLSLILKELDKENIVHRSINPKNIIIQPDENPVLINFELCKLDFLPTLPPQGRRLLDSYYEAREVNSGSSSDIGISADIYSFGQVVCEMLRGSLLFKNQSERRLATTGININWYIKLAKECNLPECAANHLRSILSNDPTSRPTTNELEGYIEKWIEQSHD